MTHRFRYVVLVAGLLLAGLAPAAYWFMQQTEEDRVVDRYLEANGLAGLPLSRDTAIRVSDQVRRDFNTDERSFKTLKMSRRPFLREDTEFLLRYKEGLCGEGTRVLVNLLQRAGFDATRITLYDRDLNSAHTLVSVRLDGKEFLVDSINSTPETNAYLRTTDVATDDFKLLHYSDDYSARADFSSARMKRPANPFFEQYWLYSYEATPYSKLLNKAGMDLRIFNFNRPTMAVSALAEKPRLILAAAAFLAALCVLFVLHVTGALRWMSRGFSSSAAKQRPGLRVSPSS